jgi:hypothetical protein
MNLLLGEAYYEKHPEPGAASGLDRCAKHEIEAGTARAVALLSASTTIFGIMNLLVTGWSIKRFGVKPALVRKPGVQTQSLEYLLTRTPILRSSRSFGLPHVLLYRTWE